jgi:hypothetical protein
MDKKIQMLPRTIVALALISGAATGISYLLDERDRSRSRRPSAPETNKGACTENSQQLQEKGSK